MVENIEKVLDRGEHLELLVKKSEDLHDTTYDFKQKSITLRNQMWWQVKFHQFVPSFKLCPRAFFSGACNINIQMEECAF